MSGCGLPRPQVPPGDKKEKGFVMRKKKWVKTMDKILEAFNAEEEDFKNHWDTHKFSNSLYYRIYKIINKEGTKKPKGAE